MDEATIVDVDGPACIIDPQDNVRLARYHRYGCLFGDTVCAYIHGAYTCQAQVHSANHSRPRCVLLFMSEHLGDRCNSDLIC